MMTDRYKRLIVAGALVPGMFGTAALAQTSTPGTAAAQATTAEARASQTLAEGWRFHQGEVSGDATADGFDDAGWEIVSVPHTWNRVGFYRPDPQSHVHRAETVNKTQGLGWYRQRFAVPPAMRGKQIWLEFDAASRIASVWLNGRKLGDHAGGFSRFRLDATAALRPGADNLLVVRTDNSAPAGKDSTTADVLPLTGDFFVHGGLYRPVRLIAVDPIHLDLADSGGSGVLATTTSASAAEAKIAVRTRIANAGRRTGAVRVVASLIDADGRTATSAQASLALGASATQEAALTLAVATPHRWQGVADPYLYTLSVDVTDSRGRLLDRVRQPFGIRTIRIDPAQGLFLNDVHVPLHGVGYHQDHEGKGWATTPADVAADVAIMREMGVNAIRLTHYQHGQAIHDLADCTGLLVWDEIPLVSAWTRRGELEPRPALVANARQQLRELIRQNGNHPSVVTWGIANEVDFGNSFPAFLTGFADGRTPDPLPLLRTLQGDARAEDPSRPTALATCCEGRLFDQGIAIPTTAAVADLGGANRYFGWYFGVPGDLGPHLDQLHAKRPAQPLAVTEYGAGGATSIHTDDVRGGPIDSRGVRQPEEYESHIHEDAWKTLAARPYLWGTFLWNSFDFATTIRAEGDAQDINTKGLVTYDRAIRKDAYYFYKAQWSDTPTVHINGRRYVDRAYPVTDVRVYSNLASTDLLLNGRSLGARSNCPDRICVWPAVALAVGRNALVARGGGIEDSVAWTLGADAAASVRIDAGAIVAAPASRRFGSDAFFTGGTAGTLTKPADYGKPAVAAVIAGATDPAVAATYREGRFGYAIPLADGRYTVTLTFVEPGLAAGARVFDVTANGKPIVKALDIARSAGGPIKALVRQGTVVVRGGMLDLAFVPVTGDAIVSAIEITR
ncbi:glycoside hydrolase family 2 TIM barrel-domain containing protein [Sphingomonas echinoides]|uniref:glycoside hydrolase family 2 TIM barrel-domain containing protein n=1 Tax=Sphingomonas echinoides TaxID=59803 RepID=UPI0024132792|nr:glycoside hydrolase family 2 TIM barrel-domain containing protein [Sphingomonas echinoides]